MEGVAFEQGHECQLHWGAQLNDQIVSVTSDGIDVQTRDVELLLLAFNVPAGAIDHCCRIESGRLMRTAGVVLLQVHCLSTSKGCSIRHGEQLSMLEKGISGVHRDDQPQQADADKADAKDEGIASLSLASARSHGALPSER